MGFLILFELESRLSELIKYYGEREADSYSMIWILKLIKKQKADLFNFEFY